MKFAAEDKSKDEGALSSFVQTRKNHEALYSQTLKILRLNTYHNIDKTELAHYNGKLYQLRMGVIASWSKPDIVPSNQR